MCILCTFTAIDHGLVLAFESTRVAGPRAGQDVRLGERSRSICSVPGL